MIFNIPHVVFGSKSYELKNAYSEAAKNNEAVITFLN